MSNKTDIPKATIVADQFPVMVSFDEQCSLDDLINYYQEHQSELEKLLLKFGTVVFRQTAISSKEDFEYVMDRISEEFMAYVDGNSPRTKLSGKVYTSTEYDPASHITLHNELSYSAKWPSRLFFTCTLPSETGGETPLADCRQVLEAMDPDLIEEIESKGITYIRNLHGGSGMGPSWQDTFETEDKAVVEEYCKATGVDTQWSEDGSLRLIQESKGIISHPKTGEKVWFNQIDQFHPSHLDPEVYETLMMIYQNEEELPMFVRFGDGSPISEDKVKHILERIETVVVARPWEKGDLAMIDNVLVAHGRRPFTGKRQVLVSMAK